MRNEQGWFVTERKPASPLMLVFLMLISAAGGAVAGMFFFFYVFGGSIARTVDDDLGTTETGYHMFLAFGLVGGIAGVLLCLAVLAEHRRHERNKARGGDN